MEETVLRFGRAPSIVSTEYIDLVSRFALKDDPLGLKHGAATIRDARPLWRGRKGEREVGGRIGGKRLEVKDGPGPVMVGDTLYPAVHILGTWAVFFYTKIYAGQRTRRGRCPIEQRGVISIRPWGAGAL